MAGRTAQLMQQMQQLASERTALQAENAKMKKELADLAKERDTLKTSARTAVDPRVEASRGRPPPAAPATKESLEAENQKLKDRMQELVREVPRDRQYPARCGNGA